jgi:hypothetical protein
MIDPYDLLEFDTRAESTTTCIFAFVWATFLRETA